MTSAEHVTSQTRVCLWAVGPGVKSVPVGEQVGDRYEVVAPQIWRDITPEHPPQTPESLPEEVLPYLSAHIHRLHVPGVYDVIPQRGRAPWVLLENAPVNARTQKLYPSLAGGWMEASPRRQMAWLWQIWDLWQPLMELGVASSLLDLENLRVEGWRVRVLQFIPDPSPPTLQALAQSWQPLIGTAKPSIEPLLTNVCQAVLAAKMSAQQFAIDLNYLLLKESAQTRFRFRMAGATHPGPNHSRNEDACYPEGTQLEVPIPRIAIVCDGVGGHEAGEVASHAAVRSLQLQLQGLLAESGHEENAVPPAVIIQQIEAAIRVVNDLVNAQNDQQGRSDRQRMGTTLVMTLIVPQRLRTPEGWLQVDELYVAHVGDSRAYWITPDYCHQLTIDDDIAGREAHAGRAFYTALRDRPEAGALTQAIGTRSSNHLVPHVQRFIFAEQGMVLLCSDGLSDNHRVESAWANYIGLITKEIISLKSAVDAWIELANQKNGHDNVSVVLLQAKPFGEAAYEPPVDTATPEATPPPPDELTDASKALLYGEEEESVETDIPPEPVTIPRRVSVSRGWLLGIVGLILLLSGVVGWWIAGKLFPNAEPETPPDTLPESVE